MKQDLQQYMVWTEILFYFNLFEMCSVQWATTRVSESVLSRASYKKSAKVRPTTELWVVACVLTRPVQWLHVVDDLRHRAADMGCWHGATDMRWRHGAADMVLLADVADMEMQIGAADMEMKVVDGRQLLVDGCDCNCIVEPDASTRKASLSLK